VTTPYGEGSEVLLRYYAAMDVGDLEALAGCFAEDATLVLPGRPERGGALTAKRGREAIVEFFRRRGAPRERHVLNAIAAAGPRRLVDGLVVGNAGDFEQPFVASAQLAEDGLIRNYMVFTAPAGGEILADLARGSGDSGGTV
jgi:ketosteroid isomerase-like protein